MGGVRFFMELEVNRLLVKRMTVGQAGQFRARPISAAVPRAIKTRVNEDQ